MTAICVVGIRFAIIGRMFVIAFEMLVESLAVFTFQTAVTNPGDLPYGRPGDRLPHGQNTIGPDTRVTDGRSRVLIPIT